MHDRVDVDEIQISASHSDKHRVSIDLPYHKYDKGVLWFKAEVDSASKDWSVEGYYSADSDKNNSLLTPVEISTQSFFMSRHLGFNLFR